MKSNFFKRGIILVLLFCFSQTSLTQSEDDIDRKRMQRDLDIMEGVLEKLLTSAAADLAPFKKVRGVYFENYGVIFQVDKSSRFVYAFHTGNMRESMERVEKSMQRLRKKLKHGLRYETGEDVVVINKEVIAPKPGKEINWQEQIAQLKVRLVEFLGNYADAIGQLNASDKITVLLDLKNRPRFYLNFDFEDEQKEVGILQATALKSDIIAFRRGKISEKQFRSRVEFTEDRQDESMKRNIDIMTDIMETALSKKYTNNFSISGQRHGIYVKGLGVLFFMQGQLHPDDHESHYRVYFEKYMKNPGVNIVTNEDVKVSKRKAQQSLENFQTVLVGLVGDYGHTLRTLKPLERVIVAVDLSNYWNYAGDMPARFILTTNKQDIDFFNQGKLSLENFRKKVSIQDY